MKSIIKLMAILWAIIIAVAIGKFAFKSMPNGFSDIKIPEFSMPELTMPSIGTETPHKTSKDKQTSIKKAKSHEMQLDDLMKSSFLGKESKHKFYNISCTHDKKCTKKANRFIVLVNGICLEPNNKFIEKCIQYKKKQKKVSHYCQNMIEPNSIKNIIYHPVILAKFFEKGACKTGDLEEMKKAEALLYKKGF